MIVSDATIWSITYIRNGWHLLRLELARIINYDHNCSFIVLATGHWPLVTMNIFSFQRSLSKCFSKSSEKNFWRSKDFEETLSLCVIVSILSTFEWKIEWKMHTWKKLEIHLTYYGKTMFLVLSQVYYWRFKSNTHNNYN